MTIDQIIDDLLEREGPGDPARDYRAPGDRGGRTNWGISERAHPEEWANGKVPDRERAREIYREIYAQPWSWVLYAPLRAQLVDCAVLHGHIRTAKLLQRTLGIPADGIVGPLTRARTNGGDTVERPRLLNNALVAWRLKLIDDIADVDQRQKINEEGWENRALKFLI